MTVTRVAIAGIGYAGETHARAIANIDDADVVAGACRTESKGRSFAAEYDCTWYEYVETMLDESAPDVLSVCTPSGGHLEPTLAAAERGVDVLCEKPLETTTERVDRMVAAADEHGIRLAGVFQYRYDPLTRAIRRPVAAGRFGPLSVANAYVPWWRPDEYYEDNWKGTHRHGGGATFNQSIHAIDAIQWIASAGMDLAPGENPVAEVFAYIDTRTHDEDVMEVEDTTVATLRYRDGSLGQLLAATSMFPGSEMGFQVAGRDGTVATSGDDLVTWQFRDDVPEDDEVRERFDPDGPPVDAPDPLETANVRAFLEARNSGTSFELDHEEARKAVEIVEAIYESAATNEPVSLT